MVLVQWQFIFNGTYSWAWQKQWYLISALTKTMVHNHGYYGTKSWLVWVLISASMVPVQWQFIFNGTYSWAWQNQWYLIMATMVLNLSWILIMAPLARPHHILTTETVPSKIQSLDRIIIVPSESVWTHCEKHACQDHDQSELLNTQSMRKHAIQSQLSLCKKNGLNNNSKKSKLK